MFITKNLMFKDDYCDYSGKKIILNHILNKKHYIYKVGKGRVRLSRSYKKKHKILQIIKYTTDKHLIIYQDRRGYASFVLTKIHPVLTADEIIQKIETSPAEHLWIKSSFKNIYIFGILRINDLNYKEAFISLGYNKSYNYQIKYIFPRIVRDKFYKNTFLLFLFFHFAIIKITKKDIVEKYLDDSEINLPLFIKVKHKDKINYYFSLKKRQKDKFDKKHYLYNSFNYKLNDSIYCYFRKSVSGNLVMVISTKLSKVIVINEMIAYVFKIITLKRKRNSIYFEKFAQGAAESAFEVFKYSIKNGDKNSYFLLDSTSNDYKKLKKKYGKNILKKNSFYAFYKMFQADKLISSEFPTHIQRRLYDNDYLIKKLILNCEKKVFLQHGVALATNLFERGYFNPRTPIIPNYIVISSELEKKYFQKYTSYDDSNLWVSGVPNMDLYVRNRGIVQEEISFILTWRPWDLTGKLDGESYLSRYMQFIAMTLKDEFYKNKKINIILHPKARSIIMEQFPDLYEKLQKLLYEDDIKDAMLKSKVVISDYSSIVFYAFAGGSNVLFYWGDKDRAEKEYGTPNILQKNLAFGDIAYNFDVLDKSIKEKYYKSQETKYKMIYHISVETDKGVNTLNTYEKIKKL